MPRYKLRTLLIVLALGPPLLAWVWLHPEDVEALFSKTPLPDLLLGGLTGAVIAIAWFAAVRVNRWYFSRLKERK